MDPTIDPNLRFRALRHVYAVYDRFAESLRTACRKRCARCCTRNVTATTLEACALAEALAADGREAALERVLADVDRPRFSPRITLNRMAEICRSGDAPPAEGEADPDWGPCGLLEADLCPVYAVRPFACRCMVSATVCAPGGAADMTPLTVTVNTVFMQTLEHLDAGGHSGNLVDLLRVMADPENRRRYREGRLDAAPPGLVPNRPAPALMIPPEHREAVRPWIEALHRMPTGE